VYYRLNVFPLELPPLRERRKDIPQLISHFAREFARRMGKTIRYIPPETMAVFTAYPWRELQNLVERAIIRSNDGALPNPLPLLTPRPVLTGKPTTINSTSGTFSDSMRFLILRTLEETRWVVGGPDGAAARLGLPRTTLLTKMKKLRISRPVYDSCPWNSKSRL
jgi:formate hydrogenlyase transcriptional activator